MLDRKVILRVLLWSLGLAAIVGAMAVLFGTSDVAWRVAGTSMLVAVACGLLLPLSLMIDRQKARPAGLVGVGVVVAEFILLMTLLWMPDWMSQLGSSRQFDWALWQTVWVLAVCGVVAVVFARAASSIAGSWTGRVGFVLTLAVFGLGTLPAWWRVFVGSSSSWFLFSEIEATGLALAGLGLPGVLALMGLGAGPARYWRWLGVAAALLAFVMAVVGIWGDPQGGEAIFVTVISVAVVVAHAIVVLQCPLKPGQGWLATGTITAAMVTGAMVDLSAFEWGGSLLPTGRLGGAAGVFAACGTLALFVLARINRGVNFESLPHVLADIVLACPRCRRKQTLPLGGSACSACGLRITIQVEEPRCRKCGYLLYKLTSDACPECGETVPAAAATAGT